MAKVVVLYYGLSLKCKGIVGVLQVPRYCGCVHVWSAKVSWVCTCVECQGIVGVYMCGVQRYYECVHMWSAKVLWVCT